MKKLIKCFVTHIPRKYLIRFSKLFSILVAPFYYGNKHECPICGGKFRKMLPYGNKSTENRLCPKCLSLERHRLIWLYLNTQTNWFEQPLHVLHIAPEQPFIKRFRKNKNWTYITADLESPLADVKMDIRKMPFNNEQFDLVICNHVLEHIDDDKKAMSEIFRVLKTNGKAILQVPINYELTNTYENSNITDPKERTIHFGQYDHVRVYGTDYPERLSNIGFLVDINKFVQQLSDNEIERYRLDRKELIYIAYKP